MLKPIYTSDYRRNLILYWQQYYLNYDIPTGYHVHHIKPKCTFADRNDPKIHHPSNLIALHPDDHWSIHMNRGDTKVNLNFMNLVVIKGKKLTQEHKDKISHSISGRKHTKEAIRNMQKSQVKTNEQKRKLSEAHKGKVVSNITRNRISKANKGKIRSPECCKAISERMKGKKRGPYKKKS